MANSLRILVVEDDALVGLDLCRAVRSFGYTALGPIHSGEEVLAQFESLAPHLILLDIRLAGKLDGISTAEELQERKPLPVVFLTGLTDDESFQRAKLVDPYGYLIKPIDERELRSMIELTLRRFESYSKQERASLRRELEEFDEPVVRAVRELQAPTTAKEIAPLLRLLPLFEALPEAAVQELGSHCALRKFEAGQTISFEGEDSHSGFIPVSGRISLLQSTSSGKELIVALLAPGNILGLQFAVKTFAHSLSARTQSASKVIVVPGSVWSRFRDSHPSIERTLTQTLTTQLISAYSLASSLAHVSVEGRIVSTLLALLPQFGKSLNEQKNMGRIYITRKELAELTGTSPETAYRVTKSLERENLLDLSRPGILKIIDVEGLRAATTKA